MIMRRTVIPDLPQVLLNLPESPTATTGHHRQIPSAVAKATADGI